MHERKHSVQSLKNIRRIQLAMIFGYALIVAAALGLVSHLALRKTDIVLKNNVTSLTSSLNVQMKLNMEEYMSRMETIATLAFGEKLAYTYDATDPDNDEFEAINTEKIITEKLYSLCIMENFVDYGIVYRNNRTVGKISNATATIFGDKLFSELSKMITNYRYEDGWFTGYEGDFKRIYYVKKVHKNAILFISFYSHELSEVFDNPETLSNMDIRLLDRDLNIIYSKNKEEAGLPLPDEIASRIQNKTSATIIDNDYLVSVNNCGDWFVVCSIPSKIILNEKNDMTRYIIITTVIAALNAALIGLYLSHLLTKPVENIVSDLDNKASIDRLTGILNKLAFEELSVSSIGNSHKSEHKALIIFDLDDFKAVNDNLGHAAGDRLLESTGDILRTVFSEDDYLGRIGGDEFCVLVNTHYADIEELKKDVTRKCVETEVRLRSCEIVSNSKINVSSSIGIALFPDNGKDFETLYNRADKALYRSKSRGKNCYTFYRTDMESEEGK